MSTKQEQTMEQFRDQLLKIIHENQQAIKRAKEKKMKYQEVFETSNIFDAVIGTWEDMLSIVTNLPLKVSEGYNEMMDYCSRTSNLKWFPPDEDAPYDWMYLALIEETEPCEAVHIRHRIIENRMNKWVLADNQKLLYWMPLPAPPDQSPQPDKEPESQREEGNDPEQILILQLFTKTKELIDFANDDFDINNDFVKHVIKSCALLIRCGCECDDYNGFSCGCGTRAWLSDESLKLLNSKQNDEVSVATGDDSSNKADNQ